MNTAASPRDRLARVVPFGVLVLCVACTETPLSTSADMPAETAQALDEVQRPLSPADAVPGGIATARSHITGSISFDHVVNVRTAPGPDGIVGTPDDVRFDGSWTGPRIFGFPSPTGDLWESAGVRFQLIDGGVAFSHASGCLGSQRPSPINNWDGGIRILFLDVSGRPTPVSAVSVEAVNPPVTLRAYAADGSLVGTDSLEPFSGALTVHDAGPIDRVELTGSFWCIFDDIRWNEILVVDLDVKPGSDRNPVNLGAPNGVLPLAILTTPDFDAGTVDHESLTFQGATETHVQNRTGEVRRHEEDVDGDGDLDLVIHVRVGDTDLDASSIEGTLLGRTFDGTPIYGRDRVTVLSGGRLR